MGENVFLFCMVNTRVLRNTVLVIKEKHPPLTNTKKKKWVEVGGGGWSEVLYVKTVED